MDDSIKKEGRLLTCQNCQYQWTYEGESDYYASCPRCLRKVKVNQEQEVNKDD